MNDFLGGSWDLTTDIHLAGDDPLTTELDANWRRFRQAILAALVEQEQITEQSAAAAARNSVRTGDMQKRMSAMQSNMLKSAEVMESVASGAREAAAAVARSTELVGETRTATIRTHESARAMADSIDGIRTMLIRVTEQLSSLDAQSKQVGDLSKVVRGIAQQVNMLSLNASIEAARAGAHGRTFAVVAQEVRKLAENTARQANSIDGVIKEVVGQIREASDHMSAGMGRTHLLTGEARTAEQSAAGIDGLVTEIAAPFEELTATMQEHTETLSDVSQTIHTVAGETAVVSDHVNLVAAESSQLLDLTRQAQIHLTHFYKGSFVDKVKFLTKEMALDLEKVFTAAISAGRLSLDDVLALEYTEIKGAAIQGLSRLFDISKVPVTGFHPPKYHTRYDSVVDGELQKVLDRCREALPGLYFTGILDLNGYQPISNSSTCQAWTGDPKVDLMSSRLKRFSTDNAQVTSAQIGLQVPSFPSLATQPYVRDLKTVLTRSEFVRLGNRLRREDDSTDLFTMQTFAGLSGKVAALCAVPVYVAGHRYGAAMVGWEPKVGTK